MNPEVDYRAHRARIQRDQHHANYHPNPVRRKSNQNQSNHTIRLIPAGIASLLAALVGLILGQ